MILRLIRKIARPAVIIAVLMYIAAFECAAVTVDPGTPPDAAQPYIVVFEQSQYQGLRALEADPATRVKARLHEQTRATFDLIDGALVELTVEEADSLAEEPGVVFVEPDYEVHALSQTVPWGVERIYEEENYPFPVWGSTTGAGIGVAVLDTGILGAHEDLPSLAGGVSTIDSTAFDTDGNGHGTHVAGIIAAAVNDVGVVGTAPGVDLYSVKVLSRSGSGSISSIIAGIEWAVENDIRIISMSLGTKNYSQALENACNAAYEAGCLVIAAAGNSGNAAGTGSNMEYPAKFDSVIAVGATDEQDLRAWFSSTGSQLELMAPGDSILSTYPESSAVSKVILGNEAESYELSSALLEGSGTGTVSGPAVYCGNAADPSVIAEALAARGIGPGEDWIALFDRGVNTFARKVLYAMEQGAGAAVIINDDAVRPDDLGKFTLEDSATAAPEGGWIPTVSISYNSGNLTRDMEDLTGTVGVSHASYKVMNGTSMATPHAAGAAAMIWASAPSLTNEQIRQILNDTAMDLGLLPTQQGSGLIQINAALELVSEMLQVLDLVSLETDPGTVSAELDLCVHADTRGTVCFALYDAAGRFLTIRTYPVEVTEYRQRLSVSADYDADDIPAKAKAFFLETDLRPLGPQLEAILP